MSRNFGLKRLFGAVRSVSTDGCLAHAAAPPAYTLATVRSFPSLEPVTFAPVPAYILNSPVRRDLLWKAVVYENDNRRVGASNPPGRSENGYSRRKLAPQKGTGRARVGDANSPTRHNGARALARTAPNDYTTALPRKVYSKAVLNALAYHYQKGTLRVVGHRDPLCSVHQLDLSNLDIVGYGGISPRTVFEKFLNKFNLEKKRLLFVTNGSRQGLMEATDTHSDSVDVVQKELLEVNDLLKAGEVFIEVEALEYLAVTHTSP